MDENLKPDNESLPHDISGSSDKNVAGILKSWYVRIISKTRAALLLGNTGKYLLTTTAIVLVIIFFIYIIPALQEILPAEKSVITNTDSLKNDADYRKQIAILKKENQRLRYKYNSYTSGQSYLVINTTENIFYLYRNKKLIRQGHCSTGSYNMLLTAEGRSWVFKTPRGKFLIQGKSENPAWRRPDWSFVEEGLPIPPEDHHSRWEYGVLGEYALALGDGYLIHGTLYKRFLGMPVTHGCVRLNDDDLEAVYNTLNIGSKVYIF